MYEQFFEKFLLGYNKQKIHPSIHPELPSLYFKHTENACLEYIARP